MTNSPSAAIPFWKTFLFAACIFIGFSLPKMGIAQDVIGKWKGVSVKNYYSADYAKQLGKTMEEKTAKETGNSELIYNADHSFIMNMWPPNSTDVMTMKGVWTVSQNQLKLTLEPKYNPQNLITTAIFTINGNTMETTTVMGPPSRIIKSVSISTRM
jgi:hypothetical protein